MLERILILVVLLSGIFFLFKRLFVTKPVKVTNIFSGMSGLHSNQPNINPDLPTIIYFWTEQCSQCFSLQNPALSKLKQNYSNFNLISYNALNEGEIVKKLNIKTVPATAVIATGKVKVKFVNNGFAGEELLLSQLKKISA